MSPILFFGQRWDAPLLDDAHQVPTPVGGECLRCTELIVDGDRGLIRIVHRQLGLLMETYAAPVHAECELLGLFGHELGVCTCTGYDTNSRAAAQLVWQRIGEKRGRPLEQRRG